ncbi:MAG: ice-binding family protein [Actinomycetota bacterium]|nr:ice-binding family protein [Actinomycetota bacterium]
MTLAIVGGLIVAFSVNALAATSVGLGTADSFGVLAGSGITNTGPTTINGDIGTFPTTIITGLGSMTINGTNHAGDAVTQGAKNDLITAYNAAAGQASNQTISADLGGTTLVSGVYTSATSLGLTGTLTLNAAGNPNAAFIFQAGSTLTTAAGSRVALINGAQACNVFWQIGSSATLGTTTDFKGNILAMTSITLNNGAEVEGRVLARDGAVTLDTNRVIRPTCNNSSGGTPVAEIVYAANIGPLAQGLVCPWGGQFDGFGLCRGSGANSLMNPSPTPTPSATPATSPSATPTATVLTTTAPTATPAATPAVTPTRRPVVLTQILLKPQGGVETGRYGQR